MPLREVHAHDDFPHFPRRRDRREGENQGGAVLVLVEQRRLRLCDNFGQAIYIGLIERPAASPLAPAYRVVVVGGQKRRMGGKGWKEVETDGNPSGAGGGAADGNNGTWGAAEAGAFPLVPPQIPLFLAAYNVGAAQRSQPGPGATAYRCGRGRARGRHSQPGAGGAAHKGRSRFG